MCMVVYSKYQNCHKVEHVNDLKENFDGIGIICLDDVACKKTIKK